MPARRHRSAPTAGAPVRFTIAAIVIFVLALATLIPPGWMPSGVASGAWTLAWCGGGDGPETPGGSHDPDPPCAFALGPIAADIPASPTAAAPVGEIFRVALGHARAPAPSRPARATWARGPPTDLRLRPIFGAVRGASPAVRA